MIVLARVAHAEDDAHLRIDRLDLAIGEIRVSVKGEPVGSFHQRSFAEQVAQASILIGSAATNLFPTRSDVFNIENDRNACSGTPGGSIQNVRGDVAHIASNFSNRIRVIL